MPEPLTADQVAALPWVYNGIFGPLSALPADFVPTPKQKPTRGYDDLDTWLYDEASTPLW
jgi:hypothetical protein